MLIQVIFEDSMDGALAALDSVHAEADAVEFRLDPMVDFDPALLIEKAPLPAIMTFRSRESGGTIRGDRRQRFERLRRALQAGPAFVDLEFGTDDERLIPEAGESSVILSTHFPDRQPGDLEDLYRRMASRSGVAVLKIVPFADSITDNLKIRNLLSLAAREGRSLAAFCMGGRGLVSRLLALSWDSWAIYGATRRGRESASGQLTVGELADLFRVKRVGRETRLFGLLGFPLGHSLSPCIHNHAFRHLDLDACYLPFEADSLSEFLPMMEELRLAGFSVTLPHKEAIVSHLEEVDEESREFGSVNTVIRRGNRHVGFNTDVTAALRVLERALSVRDRRVALLGAGGTGAAIARALHRRGALVTIYNRTPDRARRVAEAIGCRFRALGDYGENSCDILINATSVGMFPAVGEIPVPAETLRAGLVFDLVYNPPETLLVREARKRSIPTLSGLEMFLEQAMEQFQLFTGKPPPGEVMRRAAERALGFVAPGEERDD